MMGNEAHIAVLVKGDEVIDSTGVTISFSKCYQGNKKLADTICLGRIEFDKPLNVHDGEVIQIRPRGEPA